MPRPGDRLKEAALSRNVAATVTLIQDAKDRARTAAAMRSHKKGGAYTLSQLSRSASAPAEVATTIQRAYFVDFSQHADAIKPARTSRDFQKEEDWMRAYGDHTPLNAKSNSQHSFVDFSAKEYRGALKPARTFMDDKRQRDFQLAIEPMYSDPISDITQYREAHVDFKNWEAVKAPRTFNDDRKQLDRAVIVSSKNPPHRAYMNKEFYTDHTASFGVAKPHVTVADCRKITDAACAINGTGPFDTPSLSKETYKDYGNPESRLIAKVSRTIYDDEKERNINRHFGPGSVLANRIAAERFKKMRDAFPPNASASASPPSRQQRLPGR